MTRTSRFARAYLMRFEPDSGLPKAPGARADPAAPPHRKCGLQRFYFWFVQLVIMPDNYANFNPFEDYKDCPSCGFLLVELHAKVMCNRCGYKRGCCDLL